MFRDGIIVSKNEEDPIYQEIEEHMDHQTSTLIVDISTDEQGNTTYTCSLQNKISNYSKNITAVVQSERNEIHIGFKNNVINFFHYFFNI